MECLREGPIGNAYDYCDESGILFVDKLLEDNESRSNMESTEGEELTKESSKPPKTIAIPSKGDDEEQKYHQKSGKEELVDPDDAWDEPKWCFVADMIEKTLFKNKKDAGTAIAELPSDLINDDVLPVRVVSRECNLTIEFSFDHENIVTEQVTVWYKEEDILERCLRRLQT